MKEKIIETKNLWFSYSPEVTALRNINLEIYKGELIALIGQNGGGKTTLAKHFNGLLKPTKGDVYVKGQNTKDVPANRLALTVGYVFQNPAHQIFTSKVYDEVAYGARNEGLNEEEVKERVEYALEEVGLIGYEDWHPYDLDYGKMKLLTVASIISMKPEVYVLDEPTTGQDHKGRRVLADLVIKLNKEGNTVIVITHDMKFVARTAKRTILLANGEVIKDGATNEVLHDLETLKKAMIKPPQVVQLAYSLKSYGVPTNILTIDDAFNSFKKLINR